MRSALVCFCLAGLLAVGPAAALEPSNLNLVTQTAQQALRNALTDLTLPEHGDGSAPDLIAVASASTHAANWLFEHMLVEELVSRGLDVTIDPAADTQLSWRVVDLGINGQTGLMGGSVTRRCRVVVRLELRQAGELVWSGDGHAEQQDKIPKGQLDALQHSRFGFAKTDLEQRTWGKYVEPVIISAVLGSLVYLFFSNR